MPRKPIPDLTDFQFLVVEVLRAKELSGREIRDSIKKLSRRHHKDGPAFYMAMSRLEKAKLIEGWYVPLEVDGHKVKERRYKVLGLGERAYQQRLRFCEARLDAAEAKA